MCETAKALGLVFWLGFSVGAIVAFCIAALDEIARRP